MGKLLDTLQAKKLLVSDGAWGTILHQNGLTSNDCPEEWNASHPDIVRRIAADYVAAGSDLVLTNSFGGSLTKLEKFGLQSRARELNAAAARLSLDGAGQNASVAGSIGPTGELLEPYGSATLASVEAAFREQISAMIQAGLRAFCVESMSAVEEAAAAVRVIKAIDPSVDVIATMTFSKGRRGYRTMIGATPEQAARDLTAAGADIVGANCGNGSEQMVDIIRVMRDSTDAPLLVHSNAGVPELVSGKTVFRETPDEMASFVGPLVDAGARIVGGCCGTTAAHIRAIRTAIDGIRLR